MVLNEIFKYSNDVTYQPENPEDLHLIIGCGSSPLVQYEGTGLYILRIEEKKIFLTINPDIEILCDPFAGGKYINDITELQVAPVAKIVSKKHKISIKLPQLKNENYEVFLLEKGQQKKIPHKGYTFSVFPGEYVISF